jgi:hypothetical protein
MADLSPLDQLDIAGAMYLYSEPNEEFIVFEQKINDNDVYKFVFGSNDFRDDVIKLDEFEQAAKELINKGYKVYYEDDWTDEDVQQNIQNDFVKNNIQSQRHLRYKYQIKFKKIIERCNTLFDNIVTKNETRG